MKQQDYRTSITTSVRSEEAFENIINVSSWWTNSFRGSAEKINDAFTVEFGETKVAFKVIEVVPSKRVVWQVTDCYLHWLQNKTEWKGTKIVWEISKKTNTTKIDMTHLGLVPGIECYKDCAAGWNQYVNESLLKLITTGKGMIFEESSRNR